MNTQSIDCRQVEFGRIEGPGDFTFDDEFKTIYLWLPGVSGPDALSIHKGPSLAGNVWGWDGNEGAPTLTPSILSPGQWHGFMRSGRLESC